MQEIFDVNTGRVEVKRGAAMLQAMAIGSCIAVAAYDPKTKNAGIAHIMLPGQAPKQYIEKTKYALDGIEYLLNQMITSGSRTDDIEVCLVGAGNVLQKEDDTICQSNIQSVTAILAAMNIPIRASILGGVERKSVCLDAQSGHISYTQGDSSAMLLWRPRHEADNDRSVGSNAAVSKVE